MERLNYICKFQQRRRNWWCTREKKNDAQSPRRRKVVKVWESQMKASYKAKLKIFKIIKN